jgi:hypothetical protein
MSQVTVNFNPLLKPWRAPQPNNVGGKGVIERPGEVENFTWQTRKSEPTQYENDFGDALEKAFSEGAVQLHEVSEGLNRVGFRSARGELWTPESLAAELRALAE